MWGHVVLPINAAVAHCLSKDLTHFYVPHKICNCFCTLRQMSRIPGVTWGTGIRGLMRGMATHPKGNQEQLVVRDKVGRPPGELGISKSMECDIFPFSALTLLVG